MKFKGKRSSEKPQAAFDVAGLETWSVVMRTRVLDLTYGGAGR
jgi:hypothetical protein